MTTHLPSRHKDSTHIPQGDCPLVLASTSVFRRELLQRLGIPFQVCDPQTDETPLANEAPQALALRLAEAKAQSLAAGFPKALIIGSDQVAIANGKIYGKPGDHERAVQQLRTLRGQTVSFFTAVCLLDTRTAQIQRAGVPTQVIFRHLTDSEIENYLRRDQPYQCAGSAKSESLGIALLSSMTSDDPTALIGLPLIALCDMLRKADYPIL